MSYIHSIFLKTGELKGTISYKHAKEYKKLYAGNKNHETGLRLQAAMKLRAKQEEKK